MLLNSRLGSGQLGLARSLLANLRRPLVELDLGGVRRDSFFIYLIYRAGETTTRTLQFLLRLPRQDLLERTRLVMALISEFHLSQSLLEPQCRNDLDSLILLRFL